MAMMLDGVIIICIIWSGYFLIKANRGSNEDKLRRYQQKSK